jgi:phosphoglycerate dehydrogenase-like enzyme
VTVLVPPYVQAGGGPYLVEAIRERRPDLDLVHAEDDEEMLDAAPDAEIVVTGRVPDALLDAAASLEWVQCLSAGVDFFDLEALEEREIALTNVSGVHAKPIGQQVMGYLLFFERRLYKGVAQQTEHEWERYLAGELGDATVGIVGVGAIGGQVAEYCQAFDAEVLGTKRDTSEVPDGVDELFGADELEPLLERSDYLVIACPLTDETEGLIDADALATLDEDAVLVNIARGEIVEQDALIEELQNDGLRGAGLDVFEEEPLPEDSPLWDMDHVLVTPHMAGSTPHYWDRAADIFLDNLDRYRAGEDLRNRIV